MSLTAARLAVLFGIFFCGVFLWHLKGSWLVMGSHAVWRLKLEKAFCWRLGRQMSETSVLKPWRCSWRARLCLRCWTITDCNMRETRMHICFYYGSALCWTPKSFNMYECPFLWSRGLQCHGSTTRLLSFILCLLCQLYWNINAHIWQLLPRHPTRKIKKIKESFGLLSDGLGSL